MNILFFHQLSTLLSAGLPLPKALTLIAQNPTHSSFNRIVESLKTSITSGKSFAEALSEHPRHFSALVCHLVAAGELSGTLDIMINRIATYEEKQNALKRKLKKALTYPTAVLIIAIFVTSILLSTVVPQFERLFQEFNAELPAYTQMVIGLSQSLQQRGWLFILMLILLIIALNQSYQYSPQMRLFFDKIFLKMPIFGNILNKVFIERFARTCETLLAAGIPLVTTLDVVQRILQNAVYSQNTALLKKSLMEGKPLNQAMRHKEGKILNKTIRPKCLFPQKVTQLIHIGEEAGALPLMFHQIALMYEAEVESTIAQLNTLLEPCIMVVLGVLVGGLVIALYLPLLTIGTAL